MAQMESPTSQQSQQNTDSHFSLYLQHKVTSICWSPLQKDLIVTSDDNGVLGVWQFEDNRQAAHRLDKSGILCLAMAPDRPGLVAAG